MLKQISNLNGAQTLNKEEQMNINGGRLGCNAQCNYAGQRCYSGGHCGCPGACINLGGLRCVFF